MTPSVILPDDGGRQGACALWFIGSSSMHRWSGLRQDMSPWVAHNRGINGALYPEIIAGFRRAAEAAPSALILYAGENDIAAGVPIPSVIEGLADFLDLRSKRMAHVPVFLLSMKPSPGRWQFYPQQQQFNRAAAKLIARYPDVTMVDTTTPMLVEGKPGGFYREDGVHMNPAGYDIWARTVKAALARHAMSQPGTACEETAKAA